MIALRPATPADTALLEYWNTKPHVIACTSDDPTATVAFDADWAAELALTEQYGTEVWEYLIAELVNDDNVSGDRVADDPRPIGAILMIDPAREPSHYWGKIEPHLRALDIWIGEPGDLNRGYGTEMMRLAIARCFADPTVAAIMIDPLLSNLAAQRFYRRLGFEDVAPRYFDADLCLVMQLTR